MEIIANPASSAAPADYAPLLSFYKSHDFDRICNFLKEWSFGRLIDRKPGESFSRGRTWEQVVRRASLEPKLRHELLTNSRMAMMIAIHEGLGIPYMDFLAQVDQVEVIEETPDILCLVIPACHLGCKSESVAPPPAEKDESTCHVCGMTLLAGQKGCGSKALPVVAAARQVRSRRDLEASITERVAVDRPFRKALVAEPMATYTEYAKGQNGGALPSYLEGAKEIRVVEETDRLLYFVLPPV